MTASIPPILALTQGDPCGVGPEVLAELLGSQAKSDRPEWLPLLICEAAALAALEHVPSAQQLRQRLIPVQPESMSQDALLHLVARGRVPHVDPLGSSREIVFGQPREADARSAMAALDLGIDLAMRGLAQALVTAPLSKEVVAKHLDSSFRGHTDYLAAKCGLQAYGRDYLMAFLSEDMKVALLSTHLPLRDALDLVNRDNVEQALLCLARSGATRIALAGLNPHAGENGLLGSEEEEILSPALESVRRQGVDVHGPISPDTVFSRCRSGEFDWVLALYHDQGLIAVKTVGFGTATNWTLGLPFVRTSPDHGTAYDIAGRGVADATAMHHVVRQTVELVQRR